MTPKRATHTSPIIAMAITALCAVTANAPVQASNNDPRNEIRSNTVVNLCNMYRSTFESLIKTRGTPGFQDQLIIDAAQAEPDPLVRRFLEDIAYKITGTNTERRVMKILNSSSIFTQPCYNTMAASYDNTLSNPSSKTRLPTLRQGQAEQSRTNEAAPQDYGRSQPSTRSGQPKYSNQRR